MARLEARTIIISAALWSHCTADYISAAPKGQGTVVERDSAGQKREGT